MAAAKAIGKALVALEAKSRERGHWQVVGAVAAIAHADDDLDLQINLIGAMHECGLLKNSLAPFWKAWRGDVVAWATRCLERTLDGDHDSWALAALLGLDARRVWPLVLARGYQLRAVRALPAFKHPAQHVATLRLRDVGAEMWAGVLELGWEQKSGELVDVARARAVHFSALAKTGAQHHGTGEAAYFLRAALPFGAWRALSLPFLLDPAQLVPASATLIR